MPTRCDCKQAGPQIFVLHEVGLFKGRRSKLAVALRPVCRRQIRQRLSQLDKTFPDPVPTFSIRNALTALSVADVVLSLGFPRLSGLTLPNV